MKYLTLLPMLLLSVVTQAGEVCSTSSNQDEVLESTLITTDVPGHLKGAKIIVRRADGKESEVPAELFKVVPRKQQRLVTKIENKKTISCKETLDNKNRVSLLGGYGAREGLDRSNSANHVKIESKTGLVGGLQYQRSLNERLSIGVQGQSNQTGSLMLGLDF